MKNSFPLTLIYENIHKLITKHYTANVTPLLDDDFLVDIRQLFLPSTHTARDDHCLLLPQYNVFFNFPFIPQVSPLIKK